MICKRKYPDNMVPLIGEIFKKNGIDIIEDPEAWDLYMPLHKYIVEDDLADLKDAKGRVVLGIKGCISYSDRILLWTNAVNMFGREHAIKLMPETFVLSCEQDLELMTAKYPEDAFILKTNGVHNRDGLLVVNGAAEVIRQKDHYAIAQRLITDLVKFNDTVFNLRAFLLLSIKDGMLTSYFFNDALCIWAESATAETDLHHKVVTNPGIQVPEGHPAFLSQLCALKNINYDNLFKDITSKLNDLTKSLLPFIGGLKNLEEAHSLKLFGVDIMIKKNHEPLICEINNYPSMGTKDSYQRDLKTKMVEDLLSLGGIRKQENQGFIKIMEQPMNQSLSYNSPKEYGEKWTIPQEPVAPQLPSIEFIKEMDKSFEQFKLNNASMVYSNNWTPAKYPTEDIPAIISSLCNLYGMHISRTTIWSALNVPGKFTDFNAIMIFFNRWKIEHMHLNFARAHLDEQFFPALALLEKYKTVLLVKMIGNDVIYIDSERGWMKEDADVLFSKSMGHIVLVEPSEYIIEKNYFNKVQKEELKSLALQKDIGLEIIEDFLTAEECKNLYEEGKNTLVKSKVVYEKTSKISESRTSSSGWIARNSELGKIIHQRGSEYLDIPIENFENIQLTAYGPGEFYKTHTDAFSKENTEDLKRGQRIKTILIYLTNDFHGGATIFPWVDLKVEAKLGRAVIWNSLDANGNIARNAYHGGLPVLDGYKCVSNIWVRNRSWL